MVIHAIHLFLYSNTSSNYTYAIFDEYVAGDWVRWVVRTKVTTEEQGRAIREKLMQESMME